MSKRGYCKFHNVPESSFNAWTREIELREREKFAPAHVAALLAETPPGSGNPFVPLRLLADVPEQQAKQSAVPGSTADGAPKECVEILVPGGAVIRFHADCSTDFLADLFRTLKS